jgi:1-deoxy-D-xylulose-5-phosphate synthase
MSFAEFKNLSDLKSLYIDELPKFCDDLRKFLIETVAKTGGHLGASLGVVELTVALHYVFKSPDDKLIFDVGHQAYPHKILTGRKERLATIRQKDGLSGFTNIFESKHDAFGAGHSSTSISAGLGMMAGMQSNFVIPIIGDGAMSAGLAFEALNNACDVEGKMIIILNDNDMSISPPTGAISRYLPRLANSKEMLEVKDLSKKILPEGVLKAMKVAERGLKVMLEGENFFESLGISYHGAYQGHDVINLVKILEHFKKTAESKKPVILHIKTQKGYGYNPAESSPDKFHGVSPFDVETGLQQKKKITSFSLTASSKLCELASKDADIFAITPAMEAGSELSNFASAFKERFFDVGIAEQHAVTFAGGLARVGKKPYCFIYSTFLQRAYDSIIHDVLLQKLPVRFMIDRAGIVGEDGATHNGVFDVAFLRILPNIAICSPSSKEELEKAIEFSLTFDEMALAIRFPRGEAVADFSPDDEFEFGKGRILQKGLNKAVLSFGTTVKYAMQNQDATVVDLRFLKPLDEALILQIFANHKEVILLEDGSIGGVYSSILELLHRYKITTDNFKAKIIPDKFIEHGKIIEIHQELGINTIK